MFEFSKETFEVCFVMQNINTFLNIEQSQCCKQVQGWLESGFILADYAFALCSNVGILRS